MDLGDNITLHHYKDSGLMLFKEVIAAYTENHTQ
jgi:hypothetical protein